MLLIKVNNTPNRAILGVTGEEEGGGRERNRIVATDHLIFNAHHLFDLNLVKKVLQVIGGKKRHGLLVLTGRKNM